MNWESAFRVVAHELRSPAGVIAGYARMLKSGRLDDSGRDEALRQLERAAGRLGDLAQQSSDLAGWIEPHNGDDQSLVPISDMVLRAAQSAAAADRVRIIGDPSTVGSQIRTREPRALAAAIASVIDTTARELPSRNPEVGITLRRSAHPHSCDVVVGPPDLIDAIQIEPNLDGQTSRFNIEAGGLGLQMILGAAVLEAHGASLWASRDVRGVTGVRFPVGAENQESS